MIKIVSVHLKTFPTQQVKVQIDGSETHTIQPQGSAAYIGLDNGETREFCLEGKSNPIMKYILTIMSLLFIFRFQLCIMISGRYSEPFRS